ncbi:MAG: hypothetical protein JW837_12830 [Sedimentisphaerales bacterium]|nr:hypothetical protein [Sedimentisphaerales bacterium]
MNKKQYNLISILIISFAIFLFLANCKTTNAGFRAAIAVRDVTPNPLLPVSGGVGPSNPTTGNLGRLNVRAMVLENNGIRIAICSTDFLGFPGVLCDKVRVKVPSIPPQNILIGATHTHSAPDCYGFPDRTGKSDIDLEYVNNVCIKLADAVNEAASKLQPAKIKIATGRAKGKIAYNYYAEQLYDPRCDVIQILDTEAKPFITLVNYACHPEVLGSEQAILSPDFVGPLYDRIKAHGGGTGIYINGAQGGMVTADCRGPDGKDLRIWDECLRIGHLLADESLRIVADAPVLSNPHLYCAGKTIELPVDSELLRAVVQASPLGFDLKDGRYVSTQLNVVNIANAQILTIPGEALPNIGYYLKRKMHGTHNLLFGLTNDAFGYILIKEDWDSFDRYKYITRTCLGEMTGEIYINQALKFINECPRPTRPAD